MAQSQLLIDDIGPVTLTKKRGMRSIRLRVSPKGDILVSAPWLVSKSQIISFLFTKKDWIDEQLAHSAVDFYDGMRFGHAMTLRLVLDAEKRSSRLNPFILHINLCTIEISAADQAYIERSIIKALRAETERYVLPRLMELANTHSYQYHQATAKLLKSRWGSCDQHRNIIVSLYLVQLPQELVDYVLLHELAHTKHLNHSAGFWQEVSITCPDYKVLRKKLRTYQSKIYDASAI